MKYFLYTVIFFWIVNIHAQENKFNFSDLNYPYEVKYEALSNNINIAYVDEGNSAETILFVHGLGSYLPAWQKNIEALKTNYRCIAIDLPGYGKSSKGEYPISLEFYSNIIVELMDSLQLDRVYLAGHSMGGQIGIITALKYSDRIDKLILMAPAGFETFNKGEKRWFRQNMTIEGVKKTPIRMIHANIYSNFYKMPKDAQFMIDDRIALTTAEDFDAYCYAVVKSVDGMVNQPVIDYLKDIKQETLIIFGANDNLIPNKFMHGGKTKKIAEKGAALIPNSHLYVIPKCGHFVQFEHAEKVNAEVLNFLNK